MALPRLLHSALLTLSLAACSGGSSVEVSHLVTLSTDRTEYAVGESIRVTLANQGIGDTEVAVRLDCDLKIQLKVEGEWQDRSGLPTQVCIAPRVLETGQSVEREIPVSNELFGVGEELRFTIPVGGLPDDDDPIASNAFIVVQ